MSPDTHTTQAKQGLSSAEAARRLAEHGPNRLPGSQAKPWAAIVLGVVTEPMFLMLLTAGGLTWRWVTGPRRCFCWARWG